MRLSYRPLILWAEDDDDDAFLMTKACAQLGRANTLFRVSDGRQATAYLSGEEPFSNRQHHPFPSLILLDNKMPEMTGLEVLAWKKTKPEFREVPAIIMSNSDQPQDKQEALHLGASAYLVKPRTFQELVMLVQQLHTEWLDKRHGLPQG